ncbi:NAD(+) diphosphatase [Altericroceibacterium xinjiangense]|uniref:NAD(+) diphosphatase n=1 Tax=Altericroceibacterium xinjiangense TaxID=762261 RepID=UPI000F7F47F0|nr:NAD(+) diphosphatase [Altericroceibacterium xinjiangense]
MSRPVPFTGSRIDRADHLRADPEALALLLKQDALLLKLDGLLPELDSAGGLVWAPLDEASRTAELVFLGLRDGTPAFAAVPTVGDADPAYARSRTWEAIALLPDEDLAVFGGVRSLLDWHARYRFCAVCGGDTVPAKGGWQRNCASADCGGQHFPRVDPVTIMLVEHEADGERRLLLGRQPRFPPRRYSALAGFVEPGESIEEAVAREVEEEAGVRVGDVTYIASQPWPFPAQLMIGCYAKARSDALTIDRTELEDARWFTRAEVADALAKGEESDTFIPPPRQAIARHLLEWWMEN